MLADHRDGLSKEKDFKTFLNFILSHFENPIWPRTIFTPKEKQVLVYSIEEALAKFRQARFLDCRINAYPSYTEWKGLNRQAPNFLFIDLDSSRFNSMEALNKTLKFIKEKLGCRECGNIAEEFSLYSLLSIYLLN